MTATKNNSIFKKLGALAMAMCLTCALAVSASAASVSEITNGTVVIYKDGSTSDESMANDAIADGYTVSVNAADSSMVDITIPLQKVYKMGFYGYITDSSVFTLNGETLAFTVSDAPYYNGGDLVLTVPVSAFFAEDENGDEVLVSSVKIDADFELGLYSVIGGSGNHTQIAGMDAVADLYLKPAAVLAGN